VSAAPRPAFGKPYVEVLLSFALSFLAHNILLVSIVTGGADNHRRTGVWLPVVGTQLP
jgi:hypothetical protein